MPEAVVIYFNVFSQHFTAENKKKHEKHSIKIPGLWVENRTHRPTKCEAGLRTWMQKCEFLVTRVERCAPAQSIGKGTVAVLNPRRS